MTDAGPEGDDNANATVVGSARERNHVHIEVGDLRIAFQRRGTGPPLVLLHGAISDGRVWRLQIEDLSDEFTVVAWDAPGCGASSDVPETFRLGDFADVLAGFIDALGLRRPHLLGHSWGSGLALELYRRHPTVPASLVLAGAYAGWGGSLSGQEIARRLDVALRIADRLPQFDPTAVPGLFSDAVPPDLAAELAAIMCEIRPAATRAMAQAFAEADLRDVLPDIAVPTLLLYGDADERSPMEVADELHAAIPTSTLVVLPGAGHLLYAEAPESFDAAVRDFLRSVPVS
jgi:pimeloyl-ACP methyl ester carboxylesterase